MSRLIDADELLSYVDRVKNCGLGKKKTIEYITKYISNMPTAFDVEKVVVQLEENAFDMDICEEQFDMNSPYFMHVTYKVNKLKEVLEIVKAGGIDE